MLIDTHCHLDFKDFDLDRDEVLSRAYKDNVRYVINIGSSFEGCKRSLELAKKYEAVFASLGVHPHHADMVGENTLSEIKLMSHDERVVAIGEVGLDYHENNVAKDTQKDVFRRFIALAKERGLPLVIHNRDADEDTLSILKEEYKNEVYGVMHCFSQSEEFLAKCLKIGLYVSFTCNLTFKNASKLRALFKHTPLDRLFLETDAPFLAPQTFRGKRNEPAYLKYLVSEMANIKGVSLQDIENITTDNAIRFFKLKLPKV